MQETQFLKLAKKIILYIGHQIDSQIENHIIELDILDNDVITIITPSGQYVINKQTPAREIWLASPVSGPYHFCYINGKWETKRGQDLLSLLNTELNNFFPIYLQYNDK